MPPINYDYYNTIKALYSDKSVTNDDKNSIIADMQNTMQNELDNNFIDEYEIKINMDFYKQTVTLNFTTPIEVIIKNERFKEKVYNMNAKAMLSAPSTINVGDYITIKENNINETYISRSRVDRNKTHDESFLLHCQYDMYFLDDDGVTINRYPICIQDNKSRPGENERAESGITPNTTLQGYVKHDEISRRFIANTNGKTNKISRVLIDGIAYTITGDDPLSLRGLLTLGLERAEVDLVNDNLELGVADYWNHVTTEQLISEIVGSDAICITDTNQYYISTNNTVTWDLSEVQGLTLQLTDSNNICKIICAYDTSLIGKTVVLTAYLEYGATYSKVITVEGLI